jgi:lipoprotein-anchoring transpeptidase ErfK/SrfK
LRSSVSIFSADIRNGPAGFEDAGHLVPAVPYAQIAPEFLRQRVTDPTGEAPGTVVVDTPRRFLYLVEEGGSAMRYGWELGGTALLGEVTATSTGGSLGHGGSHRQK